MAESDSQATGVAVESKNDIIRYGPTACRKGLRCATVESDFGRAMANCSRPRIVFPIASWESSARNFNGVCNQHHYFIGVGILQKQSAPPFEIDLARIQNKGHTLSNIKLSTVREISGIGFQRLLACGFHVAASLRDTDSRESRRDSPTCFAHEMKSTSASVYTSLFFVRNFENTVVVAIGNI